MLCFSLTGVPGKPVITGVDDAVEEGGKVTLICMSSGSKPPAKLQWYRDQEEIQGTNTRSQVRILLWTQTVVVQ